MRHTPRQRCRSCEEVRANLLKLPKDRLALMPPYPEVVRSCRRLVLIFCNKTGQVVRGHSRKAFARNYLVQNVDSLNKKEAVVKKNGSKVSFWRVTQRTAVPRHEYLHRTPPRLCSMKVGSIKLMEVEVMMVKQ